MLHLVFLRHREMRKIRIKIKTYDKDVILPEYKTKDSAGCDLVNIGESVKLYPLDRALFLTGVHISLPEGYEAQVRGRSGLNAKRGIVVPVGTIDSDYRGEIGVVLYNLSREPVTIMHGDRIAQLVISPVIQADWQQVDHLDKTDRGDGGFGSTGK